ncbi:asparagine synthase (glutamine-hydrolyzing) [Pedobacter sp. UYP30]|uniref:asparagine synthase (glutamine-hydrolyzing) n=1 Tax=Pedobacter sp. UYP30 TaxID=1756400 RepID=UPI003399CA1F
MCRIAGVLDKTNNQIQLDVKSMCDSMAHGGPDDDGIYYNEQEKFAFGNRRLAILDLSKSGHQPMFYNNNELVITFNGEIYNYLELKDQLKEEGFLFSTKTDTEVILASYKAWGIECFNKFNGMFAFALYDGINKKTYLVRDKSGIKPLYYYSKNKKLLFASEVKAFKTANYQFKENPDWQIYFLAFGHIPEPFTTFADLLMLPKAHYLVWDHKESLFDIKNYNLPPTKKIDANRNQAIDAVFATLRHSVEKQLISDAPIGVFLSGGIDSSIITLLANDIKSAQGKQQDLNTISINFKEAQFSEKIYQDIILERIGGNHSQFEITADIFNSNFERALNAMDQPSTDGINSWFVNYFAKEKGLKAVLSGIGADELFGGYPSFKRMKFVNLLSQLPSFILRQGNRFKGEIFKRAYYLSYKNTIGQYLFLRGIFSPIEIASLLGCSLTHVDKILQSIDVHAPIDLNPKEKASWMEMNLFMQNQLLKDTDAMSMQHGIEVRVPFLDQDLIQLLQTFASNVKFYGSRQKPLLIDSFKNLLPKAIWNRPKMGFSFPFELWLKNNNFFDKVETSNQAANVVFDNFKIGKVHWSKALALYLINK